MEDGALLLTRPPRAGAGALVGDRNEGVVSERSAGWPNPN